MHASLLELSRPGRVATSTPEQPSKTRNNQIGERSSKRVRTCSFKRSLQAYGPHKKFLTGNTKNHDDLLTVLRWFLRLYKHRYLPAPFLTQQVSGKSSYNNSVDNFAHRMGRTSRTPARRRRLRTLEPAWHPPRPPGLDTSRSRRTRSVRTNSINRDPFHFSLLSCIFYVASNKKLVMHNRSLL